MGGIADYSGSLMLELPLAEATLVALQRNPQRLITIVSLGTSADKPALEFRMPFADFETNGGLIDYNVARDYFQRNESQRWAAYVAGAFLVLSRELGISFAEGVRILIQSNVPEGKGVSSSAALEIATMQAIVAAFEIKIEPVKIALLCQKVENLIAGAPCGVMDQMSSMFGETGRLFALECQPANIQPAIAVPDGVSFWGIDSGIRHSVFGNDYGSVRIGAFMGYRMIAEMAGLKPYDGENDCAIRIEDHNWGGYLANITPSEFDCNFAEQLPDRMKGSEFLERYKGTTDTVTKIDPERIYAVKTPTAHPVYENHRVRAFAEILAGELTETDLKRLGEMMYQSHDSYSACGLGSTGTDLLVDLVREAGPERGLFGAKITGGGSGGTVAILARSDAGEEIQKIADSYQHRTGYRPYVFHGSSPGAASFGHLKLKKRSIAEGE